MTRLPPRRLLPGLCAALTACGEKEDALGPEATAR